MTTAEVTTLCRSLQKVTEELKWGDNLVFKIGNKMFCIIDVEEAGTGRYSFKCAPGQFEMMIGRSGVIPAPYMARAQWVTVVGADALDSEEARGCIENSYRMVIESLPKKLRAEVGL